MIIRQISHGFAVLMLIAGVMCAWGAVTPSTVTHDPAPLEWRVGDLSDRMHGAWAGKMIGVVAGTPFEFRSCGRIVEGPIQHDYPTTVALLQDDIYVNLSLLEVLDRKGVKADMNDFAEALRNSQFGLYHANLAARRNLLLNIPPPLSGRPPYNLHADDIDFQIEADFIGLVSPGMPRAASELAFRVGPIINYGDGVYGGVFVANLYALAFAESDPVAVVKRAVQSLPEASSYRQCIETVLASYLRNSRDWRAAWQAVQDQWDGLDWCPGGLGSPFNIDAKINGAYVAIALVFGEGDFQKTMEIGVRCGQDADCNPSTALGVLGAMRGYRRLPKAWRDRIDPIEYQPFANVKYSLRTAVETTFRLAMERLQAAGGTVRDGIIQIRPESPQPPAQCEQWARDIVPARQIPFGPSPPLEGAGRMVACDSEKRWILGGAGGGRIGGD